MNRFERAGDRYETGSSSRLTNPLWGSRLAARGADGPRAQCHTVVVTVLRGSTIRSCWRRRLPCVRWKRLRPLRPIWDLAVAVEVVAVRVGAVRGRLSADVGLRDRFPESCGHVATDLELWRGARRSRGCVVRAGCGGGPRLRAAGRRRSRSRSCSGGAGSAGWSRHRGGVRGGGRVGGVGAADHDELCGEWPEVLDLVHGAAGVARGRAVDPAVGDRDAGSSSSGGLRRWSGRRPPLLAGSPRGRVSYQGTSDRWRAERCCSPVGCVGVPVASLTSLGKVGWVLSRTRRRNASSATTACSWAARNGA